MVYFLKDVTWISPGDPQHGNTFSIRIGPQGVLACSQTLLPEAGDSVLEAAGTFLSPGWVDSNARTGEPGNPENETWDSSFRAAASGGFTQVQILPDTKSILQTVEAVRYHRQLGHPTGVQIQVSGAATRDLNGQKMAEILRLEEAGVCSVSSVRPISDAGFFCRLLQYLSHSNLPLFHAAWDPQLCLGGQMHEGWVSDRIGLGGIPELAEELMVLRDLAILRYTGGKIHYPNVSGRKSVEAIARARSEGLAISAGISSNYLAFTHEALLQFDTVHKVMPPYRLEEDRQALIQGIREGVIQILGSAHTPVHPDAKDGEFDLAAFGISHLETSYAALATSIPDLSPGHQVSLLSLAPRALLGLPTPTLLPDSPAEFTWFDPKRSWTVQPENWQSKSRNNPFQGNRMQGAVLGIFTPSGFTPNPHLTHA